MSLENFLELVGGSPDIEQCRPMRDAVSGGLDLAFVPRREAEVRTMSSVVRYGWQRRRWKKLRGFRCFINLVSL